jgi:ribosome-associated protein
MNNLKHNQLDTTPEKPSKSQRKREAAAVQVLAASLLDLKPALINKLPLSDTLREAILAARLLPQGSARKRQVQYIGKLMRQSDMTQLQAALDELQGHSMATRQRQYHGQQLLHELLAGEEANLTAFFQQYPQADRQHLRQLIRNASRENTNDPMPRTHRILLRYLQEIIGKTVS